MSRHEERTYRVGRKRLCVPELKAQRERLRQDLEQYSSRKPDATVITSLKERIRALDAEIAAAEAERKNDRPPPEEDDEPETASRYASTSTHTSPGRFPPRGWPTGR